MYQRYLLALALATACAGTSCYIEPPSAGPDGGFEDGTEEAPPVTYAAGWLCPWNGSWIDCNTVAANRCNSGTINPIAGGFSFTCKSPSGATAQCNGTDSYSLGTRSDTCNPPQPPEPLCSGAATINRCNTQTGKDYDESCSRTRSDCVTWTWSVGVEVSAGLEAKIPFCAAGKTEVKVSGSGARSSQSCDSVTYPCSASGHVGGCGYCGLTFNCQITESTGTSVYPIKHQVTFKSPSGAVVGSASCDNGEELTTNTNSWSVQPPVTDCSPGACGEDGAPDLSDECLPPDAGIQDAGIQDGGGTQDGGGIQDSGTPPPPTQDAGVGDSGIQDSGVRDSMSSM